MNGLQRMVKDNMEDITKALAEDLGKPKFEGLMLEQLAVVGECETFKKNLSKWMKPQVVGTPLEVQPGRSMVVREPKGVALVMAPWNFPINLPLTGMIPAIAAGNAVVLKPSEVAPACEKFLADNLPRYLDPDATAVVTGGVQETTELLKHRWDHIMYTGNGPVGRIVMRAAAEHLTPVTLELGGKSPTVVLPGAKLDVAARRILSGKTTNCGQVCVAPDYMLVHASVESELLDEMKKVLQQWFGQDASTSIDYARIINERHWERLSGLMEGHGGTVVFQAGKPEKSTKFFPPTLIRNPDRTSALMQEEIFGPLMPIVSKASIDEIVDYINAGDKPLAMYIFGKRKDADQIISRTSSGGVAVNDTVLQVANGQLPFGGVGASGMGNYHGKWGFDEFSHKRAVIYRGATPDPSFRYPPFTPRTVEIMEQTLIHGPPPPVKTALQAVGVVGALTASGFVLSRFL